MPSSWHFVTLWALLLSTLVLLQCANGWTIVGVSPDGLNGEHGAYLSIFNVGSHNFTLATHFPSIPKDTVNNVTSYWSESSELLIGPRGDVAYVLASRRCTSGNPDLYCYDLPDMKKAFVMPWRIRDSRTGFIPPSPQTPCEMPFPRDKLTKFFTDGKALYMFYDDNNLKEEHLISVKFKRNETMCIVTDHGTVPKIRLWMNPVVIKSRLYFVAFLNDQHTLVNFSLDTMNYTTTVLPNQELSGQGWTMSLAHDPRTGDMYLHNTNRNRIKSLYRILPNMEFVLLSKGSTGLINIAMAFSGPHPFVLIDGALWQWNWSYLRAWDLQSLEKRELSYQFTNQRISNGDWKPVFDWEWE